MTSDRELLRLAAKAAGIEVDWRESVQCFCFSGSPYNVAWNPLTDDGDALRLTVKLGLALSTCGSATACGIDTDEEVEHASVEHHGADPYAATRRAIVRAAAEVGRQA